MMPKGLFIAGTDTDAGKTIASAFLVSAFRERGIDTTYQKTVGTEGQNINNRLYNPDAIWIHDLVGLQDDLALVNPICLEKPLTPLAASRLENKPFTLDQAVGFAKKSMAKHELTVFEGAGGLLAPLTQGTLIIDLIKALDLPVLLVGRPGLGTISHTLLSLREMERQGIKVIGFCHSGLKKSQENNPAVVLNPGLIMEYTDKQYLGTLPWLENIKTATAKQFAVLAEKNLRMDLLLSLISR